MISLNIAYNHCKTTRSNRKTMNHVRSSDIKLLGKDGKMQFENEYNFTTRRPAPVLSVKLKKLKDGLYFGTRKYISDISETIANHLRQCYRKSMG